MFYKAVSLSLTTTGDPTGAFKSFNCTEDLRKYIKRVLLGIWEFSFDKKKKIAMKSQFSIKIRR